MPGGSHEFDVHRLAALARLTLTPEEQSAYTRQLEGILALAALIQSVDTSGVPPTAQVNALEPVERADETTSSLDPATATAHAPGADPPWFRVPRVLG